MSDGLRVSNGVEGQRGRLLRLWQTCLMRRRCYGSRLGRGNRGDPGLRRGCPSLCPRPVPGKSARFAALCPIVWRLGARRGPFLSKGVEGLCASWTLALFVAGRARTHTRATPTKDERKKKKGASNLSCVAENKEEEKKQRTRPARYGSGGFHLKPSCRPPKPSVESGTGGEEKGRGSPPIQPLSLLVCSSIVGKQSQQRRSISSQATRIHREGETEREREGEREITKKREKRKRTVGGYIIIIIIIIHGSANQRDQERRKERGKGREKCRRGEEGGREVTQPTTTATTQSTEGHREMGEAEMKGSGALQHSLPAPLSLPHTHIHTNTFSHSPLSATAAWEALMRLMMPCSSCRQRSFSIAVSSAARMFASLRLCRSASRVF